MKTYTRFEMYYDYGGHGGPYSDLIMAAQRARELIAGDKSQTLNCIEIRPHGSRALGGFKRGNVGSHYVERTRME